MFTALKRKWRGLRRGEPGKRFLRAHENARRHRKDTPVWQRILRLVLALVSAALGVVFTVLPGPAIVFYAFGGVLLASESRWVTVGLDWTELRLRASLRRARKRWRHLNRAWQIVLMILGACASCVVTGSYLWYLFMR